MTNKELIDRIFKEPGNKFELTEFERGGVHTARTMMPSDDIQCGAAAENSKTIWGIPSGNPATSCAAAWMPRPVASR